tara:strand:- start:165 stop:497 length:333 start_codon:yes stop_codon:yes gene_type:complete
MGMSKDELNDIRLRYIKEELYILFKNNFYELENKGPITTPILITYDKFTFEYGYTNINDTIEPDSDSTTSIYEKITIDGEEKKLSNIYSVKHNVEEEIINKRIMWILERI